jgi:putative transposase
MEPNRIYLFVHVILEVRERKPLLKNVLRVVYFAWLKKTLPQKGIRIHAAGGGEEHVHLLIQLHPAQNLQQVVKQLKEESLYFIGTDDLLKEPFLWEDEYTAFTVSPGSVKQTVDYIERQDEYHLSRTLEQEMEQISKTRIDLHDTNN